MSNNNTTQTKEALIIIDVQNYFITDLTRTLPGRIRRFLKERSANFDFILFTTFRTKKDSNYLKKLDWEHCLEPPDTEITKELQPFIKSDNIFEKNTYSVFKCQELLEYLRRNLINKIYLCGLKTEACVLASAFEGFDLGYDIRIISDLCGSSVSPDLHEWAIENIRSLIDPSLSKN